MRPVHVNRLVAFFEHLSPENLGSIGSYYTVDAYFKDPFNEVNGVDRIEAIFRHMYLQIAQPTFVVRDWIGGEQDGFIVWDLKFVSRWMRGDGPQTIHGVSHVCFDASGKVTHHRDYWDTAEELYEKLPLIGWFMRRLRKALA